MRRLAVLFVIAALAAPAAADWYPDDPAKWVQFPDLDITGIDVNCCEPFYLLADDFQCTVTGPITDIHVWGSWFSDYLPFGGDPYAVDFTLSLHADIPAEQSPTGYSIPGEVLWLRQFTGPAGEFVVQLWQDGIDEGWMEPPDYYVFPGDHVCWQYNFFIDEVDAFIQEGTPDDPVTYWLDVQATPHDQSAWFGWKTSPDHWNDDAVWGLGPEPYFEPWFELRYPPGHQWWGDSIDLAFVITTTELDYGDAPDPPYPTLAANLGANHVIVPGIYMGAGVDPEGDGQPDPNALGDDNDGNDDEDGVVFLTPFTPGGTANVDITVSVGGYIDAWVDWNGDGSWAGEQAIASLFLGPGTTTVPISVPASAVAGLTTYARFRFSTVGGLAETGGAPDGEVEDYEVLITEGEAWKWLQSPDLGLSGIDVNCTDFFPYVLADDWLCTEPGLLDEIHIWGSWLGDYLPFGVDPEAVMFTLSIHEDIPAQPPDIYSRPGDLLWLHQFLPGEYNVELYAEQLEEGWLDPPDYWYFPADSQCWHYWFSVPPDLAFYQEGEPGAPVVYWLDVQANVYDINTYFGWKTSLDHWNDDAVWGLGMEPWMGPWYELRYPDGHIFQGQSMDLAFELRNDTGSGADQPVPERAELRQNVPNPFNPKTTIVYEVPAGGSDIRIEVFDVSGRLVRTLVDGFEPEGSREVVWDGRDNGGNKLGSGVYFYRLVTRREQLTRKMLLVK